MNNIKTETLINVLSKMLGAEVTSADYQVTSLQGGTIGDVQLITGIAHTACGSKLPYNVVYKRTNKFERHKDPHSWRREYDLYQSDLGDLFTDSLRWPECYHAEISDTDNQLWLEYIEGVSGLEMTPQMYERAAMELGRFQGKLYAEQPNVLQQLANLSNTNYLKDFYMKYRLWPEVYDYIRSDSCELPKKLCKMLIDIDKQADEIFARIERLPIVFCHRDFWVTNILCTHQEIGLID